MPVMIVSDGFNRIIEPLLKRFLKDNPELLANLPVFSNRLEQSGEGFRVLFPEGALCKHGCANCKERLIDQYRQDGEKVIFVGDGLSDRFAAKAADLTFAKNKLLEYCQEGDLPHRAYSDFSEIDQWLSGLRKDHYVNV